VVPGGGAVHAALAAALYRHILLIHFPPSTHPHANTEQHCGKSGSCNSSSLGVISEASRQAESGRGAGFNPSAPHSSTKNTEGEQRTWLDTLDAVLHRACTPTSCRSSSYIPQQPVEQQAQQQHHHEDQQQQVRERQQSLLPGLRVLHAMAAAVPQALAHTAQGQATHTKARPSKNGKEQRTGCGGGAPKSTCADQGCESGGAENFGRAGNNEGNTSRNGYVVEPVGALPESGNARGGSFGRVSLRLVRARIVSGVSPCYH